MLIALGQINPIIGSFSVNRAKIVKYIKEAKEKRAELIIFPELSLCGYPPEDLLLLPEFIAAMEEELKFIQKESHGIAVIVGLARKNPEGGQKRLLNSACILVEGEIIGYHDKILLPDYDVFSEPRYFDPGKEIKIWDLCGKKIAISICEDIWSHANILEYVTYTQDPINILKGQKIDLLVNLSASPFFVSRESDRQNVCVRAARTLGVPLVLVNQVGGNDSLIFDGNSLFVQANGELVKRAKNFQEELLFCGLDENKAIKVHDEPIENLYHALVLGTRDFFHKLQFKKAILGLSGGIDSALVAALAAEALGKENVLALFMPSRYTSLQSQEDAKKQAALIGIEYKEIPIEGPFKSYLELLKASFQGKGEDVTEENLQARVRGMILMAFSNKWGYLVLGTGNKSEMAMGYATLYGDMCGGIGIIADLTKEQVTALCLWLNRKKEIIVPRIIEKPPSAELKFEQKDSDSLPPYSILDFVLKEYVENHLSPEKIAEKGDIALVLVKELVKKIHLNEYKRQQAPPGLRVTKRSFTKGWRFPIVQHWNI